MRLATTKAKKKKPKKKSTVLNVDGVDVPVTFNTTGRLDKKSQTAFNSVLNKKLQSGLASRFSMSQGVEALGFGGLIFVWYAGGDVLSGFLGGLPGAVTAALSAATGGVVNTEEEAAALLGAGLVGLAITQIPTPITEIDFSPGNFLNTLAAPFLELANGAPKNIVKDSVVAAVIDQSSPKIAQLSALNLQKRILTQAINSGNLSPEKTEQAEIARQQIANKIRELEQKPSQEQDLETAKRIIKKSTALLRAKKIAWATGMAYVTKKFLENYTFSQFVENAQFL